MVRPTRLDGAACCAIAQKFALPIPVAHTATSSTGSTAARDPAAPAATAARPSRGSPRRRTTGAREIPNPTRRTSRSAIAPGRDVGHSHGKQRRRKNVAHLGGAEPARGRQVSGHPGQQKVPEIRRKKDAQRHRPERAHADRPRAHGSGSDWRRGSRCCTAAHHPAARTTASRAATAARPIR